MNSFKFGPTKVHSILQLPRSNAEVVGALVPILPTPEASRPAPSREAAGLGTCRAPPDRWVAFASWRRFPSPRARSARAADREARCRRGAHTGALALAGERVAQHAPLGCTRPRTRAPVSGRRPRSLDDVGISSDE